LSRQPPGVPGCQIDIDTAEGFRAALLRAATDGHATIVVDLTGTRFCDSGGLKALDAAHQRALDEGGELRLVLPASGTIVRILAITGLNRCIPCFTGLDQALAAPQTSHAAGPASLLQVTVGTGAAGPVIILAGEADQASHSQLAEVLDAQLSGQSTHLTIEISKLRSADSSFIRALAAAAVVLRHRGGNLILMHPQQPVRRLLTAMRADHILTIR